MTDIYISLRAEIVKMLRARVDKAGNIKKQEALEVIRSVQMSSIVGMSDAHKHTDIFAIGCCALWEDAVIFNFIGKREITVEELVEAIMNVRVEP
jgi:hypothetical protein